MLAWVGDVVNYEQRQETLARVGLGTMLGITAGQLFGGLLTDTLGWRWAFGLMALTFASVSFLLGRQLKHLEPIAHPTHAPTGFFKQLPQTKSELIKMIDLPLGEFLDLLVRPRRAARDVQE